MSKIPNKSPLIVKLKDKVPQSKVKFKSKLALLTTEETDNS